MGKDSPVYSYVGGQKRILVHSMSGVFLGWINPGTGIREHAITLEESNAMLEKVLRQKRPH